MVMLRKLHVLLLGLSLGVPLALAQAPPQTAAQDAKDIVVHVKKDGATIIVDVEMAVQVPPLAAWEVLTDYDHMAQFVTNVQASKITDQYAGRRPVRHRVGLLKFSLKRHEVGWSHREVRSRSDHGDEGFGIHDPHVTTAAAGARLQSRRIRPRWVPPVIGTAFRNGDPQAVHELRNEMMRRTLTPRLRAGGSVIGAGLGSPALQTQPDDRLLLLVA
jgi:hypothetical protein